MIDIVTVGTGGGSIAWAVAGGHAEGGSALGRAPSPGPRATADGGSEPTVDRRARWCSAASPPHLLGGEIPLDAVGAEAA